MAKSPENEVELHPDAWERFERAAEVVGRSPPQHRAKTEENLGKVKTKPPKAKELEKPGKSRDSRD